MKQSALFLVIVCFTTFGFGQTKLQYNLNKGDIFTIKQSAKQTITQEVDGAHHVITNNLLGQLLFTVLNEENDHYIIDLTFTELSLKMDSSIQGTIMDVNTKEIKEGDMQSKIFNTLLNSPVKIKLSKNGDIINVQGGDSLVNKMVVASGLTDDFSLNMMKKSLQKEYGSEALSNSYEQMTFIYDKQAVKEGDSWKNTYSGKMTVDNTWTLNQITTDSAHISGVANIVMDLKEPLTIMKLNGTQETKIVTDVTTGFINNMSVKGSSEGISTMMGGQEIPTTIESTITYELINQ